MTKISASNVNISGNLSASVLSTNNATIDVKLTSGNVLINSTGVSIGTSVINSTFISVPSLTLGGSLFPGLGGIINYQEFAANGTWTKPASTTGNESVFIMMWGGGGGAWSDLTNWGGGGGGACFIASTPISFFDNTCSVTVGDGGISGNATVSTAGGNSVFVINTTSTITAYGGGKGANGTITVGGGGGWFGNGLASNGGPPLGGNSTATISTFGGGSGIGGSAAGNSIFGGGGGAWSGGAGRIGGFSVYGAGGGGSIAGNSIFGGKGANDVPTFSANSMIPGGGQVANATGGTVVGRVGGRGEVRVWVIR